MFTFKPDFSEAVDDPIATALRHAQAELRTVLATNKARRARLAAVARDRLAYQEYIDLRDALDKNIANLYAKLQKKDGPKSHKKKKKPTEINGAANGVNGVPIIGPSPASLGLAHTDEYELTVPEQLKQLVQTRRQWVDTVGSVFEQKERESPGRILGLPKRSLYEGIHDEVAQELERLGPSSRRSTTSSATDSRTSHSTSHGKGKAKARTEDVPMELG